MKTSRKIINLALISIAAIANQASAQPFLIASDNFDRPDGALTGSTPTPGPGSDWTNHSGTVGDMLISSGQAQVQHSASEDTHILFTAQSTGVLSATFDITVNDDTVISGTDSEYFAHFFTEGSFNFRSRLDVVPPSGAGDYSLGIATGASAAEATFPTDFTFGVPYTVILEFNLGTGIGSLTVGGTTIVGTGVYLGETLDSFALRQSGSSNNETILVDNLVITGATEPPPPPAVLIPELTASLSGADLDISFETEADVYYRLQSSTGLSGFENVAGQALIGTGTPASFTETAPATGSQAFYLVDVLEAVPVPEISGLSKVFAGIGQVVTVAGSDLELATAVTINSNPASFALAGGTLNVTVPVGAGTGFVEVTNSSGTGTSEFVVITETGFLVYQQEFTTGLDDFTTVSLASNVDWAPGTSGLYETYIGMNGFSADVASDDWLISPAIDLSAVENAYMHLGHERSFGGPPLVVQVSTDYAGDVTAATWTPLTVSLAGDSTSTVTDTGVTSLAAYDGQIIHIAIQYTSTAPGAGNGASDRIHYFAVGGNPVAPPL